jgi:hypothetical protein
MTSLCQTCSVEHASDSFRVECTKIGFRELPIERCSQYKPTREKLLEDAIDKFRDTLTGGHNFTNAQARALMELFQLRDVSLFEKLPGKSKS